MAYRHHTIRIRLAILLLALILLILPAAAACGTVSPDTTSPASGDIVSTTSPSPTTRAPAATTDSGSTATSGDSEPGTTQPAGSDTTANSTTASDPSASDAASGTSAGTTAATTTPPATTTTKAPSPTASPTPSPTVAPTQPPADALEIALRTKIAQGLDGLLREYDLTSALEDTSLSESELRDALDLVHALYKDELNRRPECFYLGGDASLRYEYRIIGGLYRLTSITLEPGFRTTYASWSDSALRAEQALLLAEVEAIVAGASGDTLAKLTYVHDTLVHRIAYDVTLNQEQNHAAGALLGGTTLCEGYARAFQLIAQRLGIPVRFITGTGRSGGSWVAHAWNLVQVGGVWYHVDVTFDDPLPDRGAGVTVTHRYFLRSDAQMLTDHAWSASGYPDAGQDGLYYLQNGKTAATQTALQEALNVFAQQVLGGSGSDWFERLYTGADLPSDNELLQMLQDAVGASGYVGSYGYSATTTMDTVVVYLASA